MGRVAFFYVENSQRAGVVKSLLVDAATKLADAGMVNSAAQLQDLAKQIGTTYSYEEAISKLRNQLEQFHLAS